jgi:hypothetical protein
MQSNTRQGDFYPLEKPIQDLMELNIRTMQNLSYVHLLDLFGPHNPNELLDLNVGTILQNGHQILDYFEEACHIMEKYWLIFSYDMLEKNHQIMQQPPMFDFDKISKGSEFSFSLKDKGAKKLTSARRGKAAEIKKAAIRRREGNSSSSSIEARKSM